MRRTEGKTRSVLRQRLEARRGEIEEVTLARVKAIADPGDAPDPEYLEGLRGSVSIALDYALDILESSADRSPPVPVPLLAQARLAARNGVTLDAVLRRYFAGYSLLGYFLIEEAAKGGLMGDGELQRLVGTQAGLFDRFLAAIGEEHSREWESRATSLGSRQTERIERLLEGEPIDTADIPYDFEQHQLGLVGSGADVEEVVRSLARRIDRRLLLVRPSNDLVWAWLAAKSPLDPGELGAIATAGLSRGSALALGEPARGLGGWRLTHQQARAGLPIALRSRSQSVRYADIAILAAVLQDDLLSASLRHLYLAPLDLERDGGAMARRTLRAYLEADRNVSSAAAALGSNRRTIAKRLRAIEQRLGCSISGRAAELRAALQLEDLDSPSFGAGVHAVSVVPQR